MRRTALAVEGVWLIEPEPAVDERGEFARTYCEATFAGWGLESRFVQASVSFSTERGTLRGMHWQELPHGETKLVRCTRGAIHDVVIDLRPGSVTYGGSVSIELTETNRLAMYVPASFAHGFITLQAGSEVLYQMSSPHVPSAARGVRWDDPAFGIAWPMQPTMMSEKDRSYPDFRA